MPWTPIAQTLAQPWAQAPATGYEMLNTQRDTAGLVILHQQILFSAAVDDISSSVVVAPVELPAFALHIPMPLIGVLTPFVVHVDVQSAMFSLGTSYVHVVLLFNATHLVTADAGGAMITDTNPAIIMICFFIFLSPFFPVKKKPPEKFRWLEFKNNPLNCVVYSIYSPHSNHAGWIV